MFTKIDLGPASSSSSSDASCAPSSVGSKASGLCLEGSVESRFFSPWLPLFIRSRMETRFRPPCPPFNRCVAHLVRCLVGGAGSGSSARNEGVAIAWSDQLGRSPASIELASAEQIHYLARDVVVCVDASVVDCRLQNECLMPESSVEVLWQQWTS